MSGHCDTPKCKAGTTQSLYHRTKYGGGPENSGWFCLKCYEKEFGEFAKATSAEQEPEPEMDQPEPQIEDTSTDSEPEDHSQDSSVIEDSNQLEFA